MMTRLLRSMHIKLAWHANDFRKLMLIATCAVAPAVLAGDSIDALQGVYKHSFSNAYMNGKKYRSTEILEILRLSSTTAYFRTHLEAANGHICDIAGIADAQADDSLMYRTASHKDQMCVLSIHSIKNGVELKDAPTEVYPGGACRVIACGSRGGLDGAKFQNSERRQANAQAIKETDEFKQAIQKHQQRMNSQQASP